MDDAVPVTEILGVERSVEAVGVAQGGDVGGGRTLAKHLDDGVAGNEMDQKKDDRNHNPEDGKRDEDAADGFGESCQLSVLSCQRPI
jgi:hypothetical protein